MARGVAAPPPPSSPSSEPASPGLQAMTVGSIVTVAAGLLVFAALALAFVLLQCYCDERSRAVTTSRGGRRRRRSGRDGGRGGGVDLEVLRSLPVTVYRAAAAKEEEEEEGVECAVCLAELEDGEEARFLPRCGHGFHAECVDLWLGSHSTCPLCRLTVVKPDASPLPPVPPEPPANYTMNLPASVLLGLSDQGPVTLTPEDDTSPSDGVMPVLVIEIPEPAAPTPRDAAARSPGSARLRSLMRLWSFGRQGAAGSTPSCSCAEGDDDIEQEHGISVVEAPAPAPPLPPEAETGATPRTAAHAPNQRRSASGRRPISG
ncbi:hypothetical protein E2562_008672 [Oryza meyeriana var. granulata]|uniref:RING-type E3 ubiquitin transferase n=1 Tax=Oryza meyeriana var. granulata TaxID=110450 RepID=A0A6G1F5J4_9ORYZ|nr:hypothetical protein E2562_008672 [Oryza meyeriana var. granulata]